MSRENLEAFVLRVQDDAELFTRAVEVSSGPLDQAALNVADLASEIGLPFAPAEFIAAVQPEEFRVS